MSTKNSRLAQLSGLSLAGVGLAHFIKPRVFERITTFTHPRATRRHVYLNGGVETLLGLGFTRPRSRRLAALGLLGYLEYVRRNIRNRWRDA
ncbi:hypothetical protein [Mycobacterium talmoniae]|uniref:Uncharacterized protein n=1 Tax=Mycobacterium talmoniae TaxID=1858794 RepID=A0A1S1NHY5_9MYCO|nr:MULTISPECIES: hypothetical protein [Mycobacterium]OHV03681.1 hypothetical protein BKN37_13790 [Mycobacterium talmoniae]PQM45555.1 hypothetical protein C1Y40_04293 [Mycobacterium talmoniae]TDH55095.1 hypothetical protein E2F47_10195 [Mycobacterium eburneum]